jgi:hypothetical protein
MSQPRLSSWFALAAVLCCAPIAFGEGTPKASNNHPSPVVLISGTQLQNDRIELGHGGVKGNDNGWGDGGWGGGGWGGGGWGGGGNGGGGNGGGGVPVPEGGTNLMYLSLAGLSCVGAIVFRARRVQQQQN